jgi:hypothetical protein
LCQSGSSNWPAPERFPLVTGVEVAVAGMAFTVLRGVDLSGMPAGGAQAPASCRAEFAAIPARDMPLKARLS